MKLCVISISLITKEERDLVSYVTEEFIFEWAVYLHLFHKSFQILIWHHILLSIYCI